MRNLSLVPLTILILVFFSLPQNSNAQFFNKLKKKVESEVDKQTKKKTDEGIDKILNKAEKDDKNTTADEKKEIDGKELDSVQKKSEVNNIGDNNGLLPELKWSKYDFIPGDNIIFEDNLIDEENGEFPSRWDLYKGSVEIAEFGGENVIMFMTGLSCIVPYLENPKVDYMPDMFTVEFDAYFDIEPHSAKYSVYLFDRKNQKDLPDKIELLPSGVKGYNSERALEGKQLWYNKDKPLWRHIAIAFNKRSLKVYYDEERMINIPHLGFNPTGISIDIINTKPKNFFIKNIRIAEGGKKLYDKFLQDGKIIANGIRFDVNKASLRLESMGIINEIVNIMNKYPNLRFSVEGHTDSDGDDSFNTDLSDRRAKTVAKTMINLGINSERLESKGWGETKPIDTNNTPEGKANNRRVEFIKL